jgi:CAAX prenyl protease-like protein
VAKAYVIPFVLYLLGTSFIARFGDSGYPLGYSLVVAVVTLSMCWLFRGLSLWQFHCRVLPGVLVGSLGILLWIVLSHLHLEARLASYLPSFLQPGERKGFNPFDELSSPMLAWAFVSIRLFGIAVLVPIAEELFWRGFLLRWLIDPEWEKVPIGEYTFSSCAIVTLMFTLAHPEWLAAASYCLLINALLYWRRDLWQCIVAHATSNFVLAMYVLATCNWWLW